MVSEKCQMACARLVRYPYIVSGGFYHVNMKLVMTKCVLTRRVKSKSG
jgi:hypothetical protein